MSRTDYPTVTCKMLQINMNLGRFVSYLVISGPILCVPMIYTYYFLCIAHDTPAGTSLVYNVCLMCYIISVFYWSLVSVVALIYSTDLGKKSLLIGYNLW